MRAFLVLVISMVLSPVLVAGERPSRVVSLDYCADQYLLMLASPDQIAGVSMKATSAASYYAKAAAPYPKIRPSADHVLGAKADLVIMSYMANKRLSALLARLDIPVLILPYSQSREDLIAGLRRIGDRLGRAEAAAQKIDTLQQHYAAITTRAPQKGTLYMTPGAYTSGRGTDIDRVLSLAGLENYIDQKVGWLPLPLEQLLKKPPQLIITSFFDDPEMALSPWGLANHTQIKTLLEQVRTISVPSKLMSCNGLFEAEAALYIQERLK